MQSSEGPPLAAEDERDHVEALAHRAMPRVNSETNMAISALFAMKEAPVVVAALEVDKGSGGTSSAGASTPPALEVAGAEARATVDHDRTIYSAAARREKVVRYLEKKRMRSFHKKIRYDVRKRLADTRPRVRGRFSKPLPVVEETA